MQWPVCGERNAGEGDGGLYQFHTVGSGENLIPFHPSLSRCHSLPQVVIALTASSRFLKEKKKSQSSAMNAFGRRQKWHIVCAQTSTDAALHTIVINWERTKAHSLFILCHSRVFCGLVCKALLIPIVIVIITFCYAVEGQCKQSHTQFGFSNTVWQCQVEENLNDVLKDTLQSNILHQSLSGVMWMNSSTLDIQHIAFIIGNYSPLPALE